MKLRHLWLVVLFILLLVFMVMAEGLAYTLTMIIAVMIIVLGTWFCVHMAFRKKEE